MKLSSFQGANTLIISQSAHGVQNGCAFDFGWGGTNIVSENLYAPCDGTVYTFITQKDGDSYFDLSSPDNGEGNNFYIEFVHANPVRKGFFKKGELLGKWNHFNLKEPHTHIAINFNGWHWIFDYLDRGIDLSFWTYGNKNNKWALWSTYPTDLQLPEKIVPIETCEVKLASANSQISSLTTQLATSKSEVDRLTIELKKYNLHKGDLYEKS